MHIFLLLDLLQPHVCDPYQKAQIKHLGKVQNKALRFTYNIKGRISFTKLRQDIKFCCIYVWKSFMVRNTKWFSKRC